jgi:hypothetical protein
VSEKGWREAASERPILGLHLTVSDSENRERADVGREALTEATDRPDRRVGAVHFATNVSRLDLRSAAV